MNAEDNAEAYDQTVVIEDLSAPKAEENKGGQGYLGTVRFTSNDS